MSNLFGNAFVLLRSQANKKQSEVAAAAGINASYLAAIEKGRKPPPILAKLDNLIAAFDVPESEQRRLRALATADRLIDAVNATGLSGEEPVLRLVRLLPVIASFDEERWAMTERMINEMAADCGQNKEMRKGGAMDP